MGRRPEGGAGIRAASWLGRPEGPLQEADSALDNALASGPNDRAGPAAPLHCWPLDATLIAIALRGRADTPNSNVVQQQPAPTALRVTRSFSLCVTGCQPETPNSHDACNELFAMACSHRLMFFYRSGPMQAATCCQPQAFLRSYTVLSCTTSPPLTGPLRSCYAASPS